MLDFLTIMYMCCRYRRLYYKLTFYICFYMIFISEITAALFLCPPRISIFLTQFSFMLFSLPPLRYFLLFYLLIFFFAVMLYRCIYDCPFFSYQILFSSFLFQIYQIVFPILSLLSIFP